METIDILKKPFKDLWKLVLSSILGVTSNVLSLWIYLDLWGIFLLGYGLENAKAPKKLMKFSYAQWLLGLKAFVVVLLYLALPVAVLQYAAETLNLSLVAVGVLLTILAVPVAIRASLELNEKGKLSDSFNFSRIVRDTFSRKFLIPWSRAVLLGMLVFAAMALIVLLLPQTILIVGAASSYIFSVVFWTYLGSKYKA